MPRDKKESHERVMSAAMQEFLDKGFEGASMREIGRRAGMTPAGLYRHCTSKEDLFNELVEPAIKAVEDWYHWHKSSCYEHIDAGADKNELFDNTMVDFARELLVVHKDEFQLLFKKAEGTRYANFVHEIICVEQRDTMEAMRYMRDMGRDVHLISEEEMHMIISAYTTALLEPFMHDMPRDKTEQCLRTIEDFFMPGWQKIMGF